MICSRSSSQLGAGAGTTVWISSLHGQEDVVISDTENSREKGLDVDLESPLLSGLTLAYPHAEAPGVLRGQVTVSLIPPDQELKIAPPQGH